MKKEIIKKILANNDLFTKEDLEKMEITQLIRMADYLINRANIAKITN